MADTSSNNPIANLPRKRYLAKRTRQIQVIPTAEALKLNSGAQIRCYRTVVKKPSMLEAQTWDSGAFCSSHANNALSQSVGANQTAKTHQESICSKRCEPCFAKLKLQISRYLFGADAELDWKAGLGAGKKKGQGKALARKRKSAREDCSKNGKQSRAAAKGCKP